MDFLRIADTPRTQVANICFWPGVCAGQRLVAPWRVVLDAEEMQKKGEGICMQPILMQLQRNGDFCICACIHAGHKRGRWFMWILGVAIYKSFYSLAKGVLTGEVQEILRAAQKKKAAA